MIQKNDKQRPRQCFPGIHNTWTMNSYASVINLNKLLLVWVFQTPEKVRNICWVINFVWPHTYFLAIVSGSQVLRRQTRSSHDSATRKGDATNFIFSLLYRVDFSPCRRARVPLIKISFTKWIWGNLNITQPNMVTC